MKIILRFLKLGIITQDHLTLQWVLYSQINRFNQLVIKQLLMQFVKKDKICKVKRLFKAFLSNKVKVVLSYQKQIASMESGQCFSKGSIILQILFFLLLSICNQCLSSRKFLFISQINTFNSDYLRKAQNKLCVHLRS